MGRCRHAPAAILLKGNAAILLEGGRAGPGRWRGAGRAPPTQGPCPPLSWRNGLDFSSCGQWEEAVICYSKAMNWIPRGGTLLRQLKDFSVAREDLARVRDLGAPEAQAWQLALIYNDCCELLHLG
ncbi:tetratricopeptide repeat protein 16 isoform 3-T5 [Morphnus guianensis]